MQKRSIQTGYRPRSLSSGYKPGSGCLEQVGALGIVGGFGCALAYVAADALFPELIQSIYRAIELALK